MVIYNLKLYINVYISYQMFKTSYAKKEMNYFVIIMQYIFIVNLSMWPLTQLEKKTQCQIKIVDSDISDSTRCITLVGFINYNFQFQVFDIKCYT